MNFKKGVVVLFSIATLSFSITGCGGGGGTSNVSQDSGINIDTNDTIEITVPTEPIVPTENIQYIDLNYPADLPYNDTVEANGEKFYQINNLTAGSRYQLTIKNQSEPVSLNVFRDLFVTDVQCDPNYSNDNTCNFVSENTSIGLRVAAYYVFAGSNFDIELTHLSYADQFEGTWYKPLIQNITDNEKSHIGIVDNYNSYYQFIDLEPGRNYTIRYDGKTDDASLLFLDPSSGKPIYQDCNPDTRTNITSNKDEACTFKADSSQLSLIAKGSSYNQDISKFIMTLTPEPLPEGSVLTPLSLIYTGSLLHYNASIDDTNSYYHVTGIESGSEYMIRLSGNEELPINLSVYDGDDSFSNPVSCSINSTTTDYCITTLYSSDLYMKVDGSTVPQGMQYTLNVSPVPENERDIAIPVENLPYSGQVGDFSSTYVVNGLSANKLYTAELTEVNGALSLTAWDDQSTTLSCSFSTRVSGGCLLNSGPNGNINIRVEQGGTFKLNVKPAPILTTDFISADTSIIVPDDSPAGINSQIYVTDVIDNITNITVEVFLEHGYTSDVAMQLISPEGVIIPLVANIHGSEYINTKFNDYAKTTINKTYALRYNTAFRPLSPLHILNGGDANGIWTLNVADTTYSNRSDALGGILHQWGISFQ